MAVELHTIKTKSGWQKGLSLLKTKLKKYTKREILCSNQQSKSPLKNFAIQYRINDQMDTIQNHLCLL